MGVETAAVLPDGPRASAIHCDRRCALENEAFMSRDYNFPKTYFPQYSDVVDNLLTTHCKELVETRKDIQLLENYAFRIVESRQDWTGWHWASSGLSV
eukprot:s7788_g3.t2